MRLSHSSVGGGAGQFHTTRWTLVMASAHEQSRTGQAALSALCQIYWYPLYTFARRRGHSPHDAQDLTQGFFLHLLEHRALSQADRLKGKFRSFLLACFQNNLSVEAQRAHALKRGGQYQVVSLGPESAENLGLFNGGEDLRGPLGADAIGARDDRPAPGICCSGEAISV